MNLFQKISDYFYKVREYAFMSVVSRNKPGPLLRLFLKLPIFYYKIGLGKLIGSQVLLLTTVGRKSAKRRVTPLGYSYEITSDTYYITAGWEGKTDWYRNIKANPDVHVQVGGSQFNTRIEFVDFEEYVIRLDEYNKRNPFAIRMWEKWINGPFDGSETSFRKVARIYPMVKFKPKN